jgi:hypothetical protein
VAYTPDWESLPDALRRVMATGVTEDEAKADLCRAVADGKIAVRVRVATSDHGMRGQVFSDGNVGVPPHLGPNDLNWVLSRPLKPWSIGPKLVEHYSWSGGWQERPLDLIELWATDVVKILCSGRNQPPQVQAQPVKPRKSHRHGGPKLERAGRAIRELYPVAIPDQATLSNAALCKRVGEYLKINQLPDVSDDTILRATGRRK